MNWKKINLSIFKPEKKFNFKITPIKIAKIGGVLLLGTLILAILFPQYKNFSEKNKSRLPSYIDIGFTDTYQAVIFWKTESETTGYIRIGDSPKRLTKKLYPSNAQPSNTHVVVIEKVPLTGLYVSVFSDQAFYFVAPKPELVKFELQEK